MPGHIIQHPTGPSYPKGATFTKPFQASPKRAEDRPVQAQDLDAFKSDVAASIKDMIQSFLSAFTKSDSEGKGESSQDQEISRDREPSEDQIDLSEGRKKNWLLSSKIVQGNPSLDQLMLMEEKQTDFESFALALPNMSLQKG